MEVSTDIIRRVRKLAAMTKENGASEAEANIAAERLNKLMTEHEISMAQIHTDPGEMIETMEPDSNRRTAHLAIRYSSWAISRYTGAYILNKAGDFILLGQPTDVEAARFLIRIIRDAAEHDYKIWASKRQTDRVAKNSFMIGFATRIGQRLEQLVKSREMAVTAATGTELVVTNRQSQAKEWTEARYAGGLRKSRNSKRQYDHVAYDAGKVAGQHAPLHKQVSL